MNKGRDGVQWIRCWVGGWIEQTSNPRIIQSWNWLGCGNTKCCSIRARGRGSGPVEERNVLAKYHLIEHEELD